MYTSATKCPYPVYAEPSRELYDLLGMTSTFALGDKAPDYVEQSVIGTVLGSMKQMLGQGWNMMKGGDFKQVGGEFLIEDGRCTWVHRMKTTRDHTEVDELRRVLGISESGS